MKEFIIELSIVAIRLGSLSTTSYGSIMHHSKESNRPITSYYENVASDQNTIVNPPNSKVFSENILPPSDYIYIGKWS